jgi:hypothetical protein
MAQSSKKQKRAQEYKACHFGQRKKWRGGKRNKQKLGKDQALLQPPTGQLEGLNHAASKKIYSPLQKGRIRVVILCAGLSSDDIRCDLKEVDPLQPMSYEALSYVWGPTRNPKRVFLNSQEYLVTQNLAEALRELRRTDLDRWLWVDALCTNQSDNLERNVQVNLMSSVYESATRVIAWLGPHEDKSAVLFRVLKRAETSNFDWIADVFSDDQLDDARAAIPPVMSRDYWFRAWIVQEIAFSRELRIRCGSDEVSYSTLIAIQSDLDAICTIHINPPKRALRSYNNGATERFFGRVRHKQLLEPGSARFNSNISPRMFLDYLLDCQCTDRRDNVFAFCNLFSDGLKARIEIDYEKPPEKVLIEAARGIIEETQDLYIITLKGRQSRPKGKQAWQRDMPSWCPFFGTSFKNDSVAPANSTIFSAKKAAVTFLDENRTLKARGYTVGTISNTASRDSVSIDKFQSLSSNDDVFNEKEYLVKCFLFGLSLVHDEADDIVSTINATETIIQTILAGHDDGHSAERLYRLALKFAQLLFEPIHKGDEIHIDFMDELALNRAKFTTHSRLICSYKVPPAHVSNGGIHVALVPDTARKRDIICGILGCPVHVVLRPVGRYYKVLGEAYVHELEGQKATDANEGSWKLENFMLR